MCENVLASPYLRATPHYDRVPRQPGDTPKSIRKRSRQVPHTCTSQIEPVGMSDWATMPKHPYATPVL